MCSTTAMAGLRDAFRAARNVAILAWLRWETKRSTHWSSMILISGRVAFRMRGVFRSITSTSFGILFANGPLAVPVIRIGVTLARSNACNRLTATRSAPPPLKEGIKLAIRFMDSLPF